MARKLVADLTPEQVEQRRAMDRLYRAANIEKIREKNCRYRAVNAEKIREQQRIYREENREKVRKAARRYRAASLEKNRENYRVWYAANAEKVRAYARCYRETSPDKEREKTRRRGAMRRASRRRALAPLTFQQKRERFALFCDRCAYCGAADRLTADHVLPLIAGGLDEAGNIAPACGRCNSSKNAKPVEEWYRRQPFFTEARWRKIQRHCPVAVAGQLPLAISA